ncbi:hypothetical protein [Paenibacillus sp. A14]|uniref:hypothetical protein n=1 Tax=Paenibacillus sp. A14 TaxID=3119820 RepID=UPI002FE247A4
MGGILLVAKNEFNKALRYLDFGNNKTGEICLKNAIETAKKEGDTITLLQASCCYGDFLFLMGRKEEAKSHLLRVISDNSNTDVLSYEINRAKELLKELNN